MGLIGKDITKAISEKKASFESSVRSFVPDLPLSVADSLKQKDDLTGRLIKGVNNQFESANNVREKVPSSTDAMTDSLRVRIKAFPTQAEAIYGPRGGSNILSILHDTNGLMFPYTPSIEWTQGVEYKQMSFVHSNQDQYSYSNTPSTQIRVSGEFTVQNYREGQYMLAVMHLLRTISKMHFGKQDPNAGLPPPIMLFSGYGEYMFNDLPVIVKDHSYSLGKEVDYINVKTADGVARIPSLLTISMSLIVQNTPQQLRDEFDLEKFRTGELMAKSKGWI